MSSDGKQVYLRKFKGQDTEEAEDSRDAVLFFKAKVLGWTTDQILVNNCIILLPAYLVN